MVSKKIAIVIVIYNAQDYLPDLFGSLRNTRICEDTKYEIIVVDNGGTRIDLRMFTNKFANMRIKVIENKENIGFAKGCNVGIREALKSNSDYIILLNQDMVVESDWLVELVRQCHPEELSGATRDPAIDFPDSRVGAVQSMIMLWDEKDKIQTSGNKIHFLGFGYSGDYKHPTSDIRYPTSDIVYASGAAMLIKREVLEKIGLLDEDLQAYHEDLDLGWRMRLAGYKIKHASKSIVYHKYSFTKNNEKYYLMERNRLIVLLKYYKLATLILIFPAFIFMELGLWFFALIKGWGREKMRSYRDFLKTLPQTLAKRKEIQKQRLIKDKDVIKYFVGKVEFEDLDHPFLKYVANPVFSIYWWVVRKIIIW